MNFSYEYDYENGCICEERFTGNCAHYLCNWLIENGKIDENPDGCYCCDKGRPIRAKEVRNIIFPMLGLSLLDEDPEENCFIYCENDRGEHHVYYGTISDCVAGTGSGEDFNMTKYWFYG